MKYGSDLDTWGIGVIKLFLKKFFLKRRSTVCRIWSIARNVVNAFKKLFRNEIQSVHLIIAHCRKKHFNLCLWMISCLN